VAATVLDLWTFDRSFAHGCVSDDTEWARCVPLPGVPETLFDRFPLTTAVPPPVARALRRVPQRESAESRPPPSHPRGGALDRTRRPRPHRSRGGGRLPGPQYHQPRHLHLRRWSRRLREDARARA